MAIGAWVRHFFNLRHTGRNAWWIPVTAAIGIALVAIAIRPQSSPRSSPEAVPFSRVRAIVTERCVPCHSLHPTRTSAAPKGIAFDTAAQIAAQAAAIKEVAVETKVMPLGNATGMTEAERNALGAWIDQGAKTR
jgi:uncharacterized membrane protein